MAKINRGNFKYATESQQELMAAKRIYKSYTKNRQKLLDKGYALEDKRSFDNVLKLYQKAKFKAKQNGLKVNFSGRRLSDLDKSFGIKESRKIAKKLEEKIQSDIDFAHNIAERIEQGEDILDLTEEGIRKFGIGKKTKESEFTRGTRADFFQYLMDLGLDYDDAEKVMY